MKMNKMITAAVILAFGLAVLFQGSVSVSAAQIKTKTLTGTVVDGAMNSLLVRNSKGENIEFAKTDDSRMPKQGTLLGDRVTITYQVKEHMNYILKDKLVKRAKTRTGVVEDATMNSLVIKDTKNKKHTFYYAGAYVDVKDGMEIGDQVQIYYYSGKRAVMVVELGAK